MPRSKQPKNKIVKIPEKYKGRGNPRSVIVLACPAVLGHLLLVAVNVIGFVVVDLTTTRLMLHLFCRWQMIGPLCLCLWQMLLPYVFDVTTI